METASKADRVRSEMKKLIDKYHMTEVEAWERLRKVDCPRGGADCRDKECLCEGTGVRRMRGFWTNASRVWRGSLNGDALVICDFGSWFNVILYDGPVNTSIEGQNTPTEAYATTSCWEGEDSGSAIPRYPETLRGFMWRTDTDGHDSHVRPDDIVEHMLDQASK